MKWLYLLFLWFTFESIAQKSPNELLNAGIKKYPIEKGMITYQVSGDSVSGEEMLVFDAYGWKSYKDQKLEFQLLQFETTRINREINLGERVFRLNEEDSSYSIRIDEKWSVKEAPLKKAESILFSLGGTYTKDTTLLNKPCKVWLFEKKKSLKELWTWNGLVLNRMVEIGGRSIQFKAIDIDLISPINQNNFLIPEFYSQKK